MFPLGPRLRRALGLLGAAGAATQAAYLAWLALDYMEDSPVDVEWVGFVVACAVLFAGVTWLALLASGGRMHWSTRVLFLALTPVTLFLFLASLGFWAEEAHDWFDKTLATAFTFAEATMMTTLPVLAVGRARPHPSVPEPETVQD